MKKSLFLIFLLFLLSLSTAAQTGLRPEQQKLNAIFKGTVGTFVLYDSKNNAYVRYNEARSRRRFSPKSTFKIPNSLIGLDTGVIKDADFVIGWNREKYPPQANWNQEPFVHWGKDHALRTAFKYSVLWYYRELAAKVGLPEMRKRVAAFNYGNKEVSDAVSNFWLDDSLKISAAEQVEFLRAFYENRLPVSKRSTDIVKDIMVFEKTPEYTLSAKTGGGPVAPGKYIGWFVGYLEANGNVYFFALNIEGASFAGIRDKRIEMTKKILSELEYLPRREK
ncbi:MAG: penicillin-binding transpeptidase domain-containing protein [Acidobacteriota bacterium]|nr:penicillin-binding transpeptidase domain-containing protein [Acidobacteriota bacterium]